MALGVVVCTGNHTYIASIAEALSKKRPVNAFELGVRRVSYTLIAFMFTMVPIVIVINGFSARE